MVLLVPSMKGIVKMATEKIKVKMGRKEIPHTEKTASMVREMARYGLNLKQIGDVLGISGPTVAKLYRADYDLGQSSAISKVAQTLFHAATNADKPNITACIFFLKCHAGWNDKGEDLGKKDQRKQNAETSHEGTAWEKALNASGSPLQ